MRPFIALLAASALLGSAAGAAAQDTPDTTDVALVNNADLVIEIGGGVLVQPAFEGSEDYIVSGYPIISVDYLSLPGLFAIGGGPASAFSLGPSFRFIDERDPADDADLFGTEAIDTTYEIGLRAGYEFALDERLGLEVYGEGRLAFGGADGFIGGLGANLISRPTTALTFEVGPRTSFASAEYMDTYFSVTPVESLASFGRLGAYEADAGFKTVGLAATAKYEFRENWFLNADAAYDRLVGDAADSPIVEVGSENQFFVGLGLSRRFSFDIF